MKKKFPGVQKLILLLGDMLIIAIAAYFAVEVVVTYSSSQVDMEVHNDMLPVMMVVLGILFNVNGLFSLTHKKYSEIFISLAVAMLDMWIIMMAISFFLREFSYSRSVLLVSIALQFILLVAWKYLFWRMENAFMQPHKALIVGNQAQCEQMITRLQALPHLHYHVKYVCNECAVEQLAAVAEDIDLVIVCADFNLREKAKIVHFCHVHGKQVFIIPDFYEVFCSSVDLDKIDDIPVFRPRDLKPTLEQCLLKRTLDIGFSLGVVFFLCPVFVIIALAVKLDSPGPVFYSQVRSGRYGKEFNIYKFRSMRQDAETLTGPVFASENDQRITWLGRFLRSTRLDELPQFINVLIGDMSVVGATARTSFLCGTV